MRKEQSVLTKIMKAFGSEQILLQHYVLGNSIDLYFPKHELAMGNNQKEHKDRNKYKEIKRQKAIEKDLDCQIKKDYQD